MYQSLSMVKRSEYCSFNDIIKKLIIYFNTCICKATWHKLQIFTTSVLGNIGASNGIVFKILNEVNTLKCYGSASHSSYLMINGPLRPPQLTHAKCMKSGSWSCGTSPLELAILLLFVMSFIILISLSHALISRPSFFSRTLAVAIRVSKFSRPRTLMKYSLSLSPSGSGFLFFTSILILPCPKGMPLSADPDFLANLPSSTSKSRFGHVQTRKLIVLRPRIWPCHSSVNIIAESLLLRPPAQLPRSMKRYGITNSVQPGWGPGRGVTTLWRRESGS